MKPDSVYTVDKESLLLPFLLENIRRASRNNIKSLLTYRQVLVDGEPVGKHDFALLPGMTVTVVWDKERGGKKEELEIIYEDENMIAINKPAGLLSIANERERERTAYHMLTDYVKKKDKNARIFVVHRLDRDTSGVFLVAKDEQTKFTLQNNWNEIVLRREYLAVVEGVPEEKCGRVKSRLRETRTHLVYSAESGDLAITDYECVEEGAHYSLLRVDIKTGRKNQIRVHMQDIGHPIAGDKKYGAKTSPMGRLALHANILKIKNPFTRTELILEAPMPKAFRKAVRG